MLQNPRPRGKLYMVRTDPGNILGCQASQCPLWLHMRAYTVVLRKCCPLHVLGGLRGDVCPGSCPQVLLLLGRPSQKK